MIKFERYPTLRDILIINRQPYCISILHMDEYVIGYYDFLALEEKYDVELIEGNLTERSLDNSEYLPQMQSERDFENKYSKILLVAVISISNNKSEA